jgi:hypothetical protein
MNQQGSNSALTLKWNNAATLPCAKHLLLIKSGWGNVQNV